MDPTSISSPSDTTDSISEASSEASTTFHCPATATEPSHLRKTSLTDLPSELILDIFQRRFTDNTWIDFPAGESRWPTKTISIYDHLHSVRNSKRFTALYHTALTTTYLHEIDLDLYESCPGHQELGGRRQVRRLYLTHFCASLRDDQISLFICKLREIATAYPRAREWRGSIVGLNLGVPACADYVAGFAEVEAGGFGVEDWRGKGEGLWVGGEFGDWAGWNGDGGVKACVLPS